MKRKSNFDVTPEAVAQATELTPQERAILAAKALAASALQVANAGGIAATTSQVCHVYPFFFHMWNVPLL
jgi:hypothetical protein